MNSIEYIKYMHHLLFKVYSLSNSTKLVISIKSKMFPLKKWLFK